MKKWTVYSLDVWGNEKDGFEVNDQSKAGTIELPEDFSDEVLVKTLKQADLLAGYCQPRWLEADGDDTYIFLTQKRNSKPIYNIYREDV